MVFFSRWRGTDMYNLLSRTACYIDQKKARPYKTSPFLISYDSSHTHHHLCVLQGHPMKPHRVRMAHNLIVNYNLYKEMDIFVSSERTDSPTPFKNAGLFFFPMLVYLSIHTYTHLCFLHSYPARNLIPSYTHFTSPSLSLYAQTLILIKTAPSID